MLIFVGPTNADLNDTLQVPQAAHRCQLHPAPDIRADIPQCNVEPIDDRRFHNGERMPPPRCTRVHLRPSAPLCRSLPLGQIIVVVGKSGFRNSCQYQNPSDEYPHSPLPFRARVEHLRDRSWMFFDVDLGLAERRLLKRLMMPARLDLLDADSICHAVDDLIVGIGREMSARAGTFILAFLRGAPLADAVYESSSGEIARDDYQRQLQWVRADLANGTTLLIPPDFELPSGSMQLVATSMVYSLHAFYDNGVARWDIAVCNEAQVRGERLRSRGWEEHLLPQPVEAVQSTREADESGRSSTAEIAALERRQPEDLIGISLDEAKVMTGGVQRALVESQAREAIDRASKCPECHMQLRRNGSHRMSYRTPFGRLVLASPRFYRCRCQTNARESFSPLGNWLGDHTSPDLQYLEARFAALLSYGVSARILGWVLPLQDATSITTWKRQVARVGARLDEEAHHRHSIQPALNEFGLPKRNPLRAVGIDGRYVKASDAPSRQEGWFEVMVGKSLPRSGNGTMFAFVHRLEPKPNERMERFLAEQGVSPAQPTTFLSDGGETVRQAQGRPTESYRGASQRVKPREGLPMARQSASSAAHA